ncbi:nucleotidyltransferase family protein [uncultured Sphaerochaeta sp.]|uniref:nucleotidyltransferase family protein n=1 Tax=uncultured Sphaerochaeta sp. TaxID=886478 RepID=UPI002A0A87D9|nr:nucleotidyltransferase family protein [uncultured Sphaerochaeta sp.]
MHEKPLIKGIILSAGLSSRMGDFKPLMQVKRKTIIENSIDSMVLSGISKIILVLGYRAKEIEAVLGDTYRKVVTIVYNTDFATTDMLYSIKIGLRALGPCDAFFLLPGDMPDIGQATFLSVKETWVTSNCLIAFPTLQGRRKHPPLVDTQCIETILSYQGEGGLRSIWSVYEDSIATVAVDDKGCETDLDTQQDYTTFLGRICKSESLEQEPIQEVSTYGYK